MIKIFTTLLICLSISFLYAKAERKKEYYPDGQLKSKSYENRRKSIHRVFYTNGQLKYKRKINLQTKDKITTVFYQDGTRKSILYQNTDEKGNILGRWQFFGKDGVLECEQTQENGVFISTEHFKDHTSISESGEYTIEIIYKKGKWKGRGGNFTRMYDKDSKLINETPLDETLRL